MPTCHKCATQHRFVTGPQIFRTQLASTIGMVLMWLDMLARLLYVPARNSPAQSCTSPIFPQLGYRAGEPCFQLIATGRQTMRTTGRQRWRYMVGFDPIWLRQPKRHIHRSVSIWEAERASTSRIQGHSQDTIRQGYCTYFQTNFALRITPTFWGLLGMGDVSHLVISSSGWTGPWSATNVTRGCSEAKLITDKPVYSMHHIISSFCALRNNFHLHQRAQRQ